MHLTLYTDYSLRVVIYLALREGELSSISDISESYGISRNHMVKVVNRLAHLGYVQTLRGRGGGIRLAEQPGKISIGKLVRSTETMHLVECFDPSTNTCPLSPACGLKSVLDEAKDAFLATLDKYTLADLLKKPRRMSELLSIGGLR